jgi:plastocyanin
MVVSPFCLQETMNLFTLGNAPTAATVNLIAQVLMGVALMGGMMLARRKKFRAHGICQSLVLLLNLIPIAAYMLRVFRRGVLPSLPGSLGDSFFAVSTAHAALGLMAEILGLYIILVAGTSLVPPSLRFEKYKAWMRAELTLWWLVILGVATYFVWYQADNAPGVQGNPAPGQATEAATPSTVTVTLSNFTFDPKELTVTPGSVVIWKNVAGRHSVRADDGSFESPVMTAGGEFKYKFEREGRYPYFCVLHGSKGGHDMAGDVIVVPRSKP